MSRFKEIKHNTRELINELYTGDTSFIEYDPDLTIENAQYFRREGSTHDGTLLHTTDLLYKVLDRLVEKRSVYKNNEPEHYTDIKYIVGPAIHNQVFKKNELQERIKIPVICEYME